MSQFGKCAVSRFLLCGPAIFLVLLVLTTQPALATKKQARERAARSACLSGDYSKGVTILSDLFVETKNPTYIFNQGRCFEQNRRYEDAISRFEEYLRVPDAKLEDSDRAAAEKHIADCKNRLPDQSSNTQAPAPQPFVPPQPSPPPSAPPETPSTQEPSNSIAGQPEPQAAPTHSGSGLRVAGIVAASVGVAAAVAGVLLNIKANSLATNMGTTVGNYESKNSDLKTYQTAAWAGYGVGAACVVTGAILYGLGLSAGRNSSTSVALLPAVGPGHAGALLTGGF